MYGKKVVATRSEQVVLCYTVQVWNYVRLSVQSLKFRGKFLVGKYYIAFGGEKFWKRSAKNWVFKKRSWSMCVVKGLVCDMGRWRGAV